MTDLIRRTSGRQYYCFEEGTALIWPGAIACFYLYFNNENAIKTLKNQDTDLKTLILRDLCPPDHCRLTMLEEAEAAVYPMCVCVFEWHKTHYALSAGGD